MLLTVIVGLLEKNKRGVLKSRYTNCRRLVPTFRSLNLLVNNEIKTVQNAMKYEYVMNIEQYS